LESICHIEGFYNNWKGASHKKELLKDLHYYEFLCSVGSKTILDNKSFTVIQDTYHRIINGRYTKPFIDNMLNNPDLRVYPQFALVGLVGGIHYKGLLDFCIFDDVNSTITIVDCKTMYEHSNQFPRQFDKYRYGLQAIGYYLLVKELFPLYRTIKYKFIVESTNEKLTSPVIYELSEEMLYNEAWGDEVKRKTGFYDLIKTYLFHLYTDEWVYDKHVVDSDGVIPL
jgi:hypothetical protein